MSDLYEKSRGQRGIMERLAELIPGYSGYADRERRRDVDKVERDFLAGKLVELKTPVKRALDEIVASGDIDGITPFEKLLNRLDGLANKLKFADRGYSGLFDTVKVDEADLDQLHQHTLSMAEAVQEVGHAVAAFDPSDRGKLLGQVKNTVDLLDRVGEYFARREEILRKGS